MELVQGISEFKPSILKTKKRFKLSAMFELKFLVQDSSIKVQIALDFVLNFEPKLSSEE